MRESRIIYVKGVKKSIKDIGPAVCRSCGPAEKVKLEVAYFRDGSEHIAVKCSGCGSHIKYAPASDRKQRARKRKMLREGGRR